MPLPLKLYKGKFCEGGSVKEGEECKPKEIYIISEEGSRDMILVDKLPFLSSEDLHDAVQEYEKMSSKYNKDKNKNNAIGTKFIRTTINIGEMHSKDEIKLFLSSQKEVIKKHIDYLNANIGKLDDLSLVI